MGHGGMDKLAMAIAAGELLTTDKEQEVLADALSREAMDETDAICIGLLHISKNNG